MGPGTLVLLRADGVAHRFFSTARCLALSCFLLEAPRVRRSVGSSLYGGRGSGHGSVGVRSAYTGQEGRGKPELHVMSTLCQR